MKHQLMEKRDCKTNHDNINLLELSHKCSHLEIDHKEEISYR